MSNEWIIAWWEELLYSFVIVLAMANVCMILFVAGLAVAERILRRALFRDPLDVATVAKRTAEIREEQAKC